MDDEVDAEQLGVTTALERTVELDSRLRQAIHDTHMVSSDFGTSPDTEEAEREALLAVKCAVPRSSCPVLCGARKRGGRGAGPRSIVPWHLTRVRRASGARRAKKMNSLSFAMMRYMRVHTT